MSAFVRQWTNGALPGARRTPSSCSRSRTSPLQEPQRPSSSGMAGAAGPVDYRADRGYAQDGVDLALAGTYTVTLADGTDRGLPARPRAAPGVGRPVCSGAVGGA